MFACTLIICTPSRYLITITVKVCVLNCWVTTSISIITAFSGHYKLIFNNLSRNLRSRNSTWGAPYREDNKRRHSEEEMWDKFGNWNLESAFPYFRSFSFIIFGFQCFWKLFLHKNKRRASALKNNLQLLTHHDDWLTSEHEDISAALIIPGI